MIEHVNITSCHGYTYTIVPGFFLHDSAHPYPEPSIALPDRFGLLDDSPSRWSNFKHEFGQLVKGARPDTQYKLLVIGRHGEGWHNVADQKYGLEWEYRQNSDGTLIWGPDAELSHLGIKQAQEANELWKKEVAAGLPLPSQLFSSPFVRAVETCKITFGDILIANRKVRPFIIEMLRETLGVYTCDKRGALSHLRQAYPEFQIEEGFEENDVLWKPDYRETLQEHAARQQKAFDIIFDGKNREHCYVSVTCHSGTIKAILTMLGRQPFLIPTGGVIALVIKATRLETPEHPHRREL